MLGIDNIIFISILVDKLPKASQEMARRLGLFMAMFMRIGLLLVLAWIVGLVEPLFTLPVFDKPISGRDLILIGGGLFLIWKSTGEIHGSLEGEDDTALPTAPGQPRPHSPRSSCRSWSSTWSFRSIPSSPPSAWWTTCAS